MPTGYTAGIIDGKVKTFQEFAKQCMRAMGACIHMRDESFDKPYEPRTPSSFYSDELKKYKEELENLKTFCDQDFVNNKRKDLQKDKEYHLESIKTAKKDAEILNDFISKANKYKPPTEEHQGIKKFMLQQLQITLEQHGDTEYHDKALIDISLELENLECNKIRIELKESILKQIEYYQGEYRKELERCKNSNEWVEVFIKSLK